MNNSLDKEYQQYLLSCIEPDMTVARNGYFPNSIISEFKEGLAKFVSIKDNTTGYINKRGRVVFIKKCLTSSLFSEGLARFQDTNKLFGFMNKEGKTVIKASFNLVGDFHEGMAKVSDGNRYGYIDTSGKVVIAYSYETANDFSCGLAKVADKDSIKFIDKTGKIIISNPNIKEVNDFHDDFALVKDNKGCFYLNKLGVYANNPGFIEANDFSEGLALVKDVQGYYFINTSFKKVFPTSPASNFKNGSAITKGIWGYSYINNLGKEMFKVKGINARNFSSGVATIERQQFAWSFVNEKGNFVTPFGYTYLSDFTDNFALVKKNVNSPYTYIDRHGYDVLFNFYSGYDNIGSGLIIIRTTDNKFGFIDELDNVIIQPVYDSVSDFKDGYSYVRQKESTFFIDTKGKKYKPTVISGLTGLHTITSKKCFSCYTFFNKDGAMVKVKYKPIYDFDNFILCYSLSKVYLYNKNNKKYIEIGTAFNGLVSVVLGLNYFVFNERLYVFYKDKYDVIDYNLFKFNTGFVTKLKVLDNVNEIMTYSKFFENKKANVS